MIQKMLKEMKDRLTVEDPPEAVPPNTGADRTEPMDKEESSKEGRSGLQHFSTVSVVPIHD